jgi:hypothetical protein
MICAILTWLGLSWCEPPKKHLPTPQPKVRVTDEPKRVKRP